MVPLEQQQAHPPNGTTYPNPLPTPSNGDTRQALQDGPQDHRHQASQPARSYSSGSQPKELYAMGAPLEQQASPGLSTDSTQQPTPPVTSATLAISATPCVQAPQPERSLATGTPCQQAEPHKSMRYQPQASGVYSMVSSGPQSSGKFNVSSPGPQLPRPYNMMPLESQSSSTYAMVLQEWQQQRAHSMVPSSSISRNASLHKPHQAHQDPVPPPLSISSSFQPVLEQRGYSSFKSVLETNVQRRNGCAEITPQLQRTSTPDGTESPSLQPAGPNEAEPDETSAATQQRVEEQQALQQRQSMGAIAETSNYNKEPEEEHVEKLKEEQTDGQEEELFLDGRESLVSSGNPSDIVPPEPQYSEGQEPGLQLDMVGSCLSSETQSDTIPPVSQHIDGPVSEPALNAGEPSSLDDILFSVHQDAVGPEPEPLLDANEASSSPWSSDAIVPQVRQRTEEPMDQAESSSPDTANQREDSTNNVPLTEFLSTKDYPNRKRTRFDDLDERTNAGSNGCGGPYPNTRADSDSGPHDDPDSGPYGDPDSGPCGDPDSEACRGSDGSRAATRVAICNEGEDTSAGRGAGTGAGRFKFVGFATDPARSAGDSSQAIEVAKTTD
ncbi:hypothetical protein BC939DRAFT_475453 [Gamsiella multidivaricata]|uniref:uncharacterized protein n=1 Tax=Gamsiella multidivaricata TaxID=101098 RepID=UPI00221FB5FB|nr:uncharacterized protein BC939DRAFT_475453 [Gamsiella multidivaricata]KAI7827084.1 hypothetical protein BC939DRAFT_475453 [Gamsiella multidivaricata]